MQIFIYFGTIKRSLKTIYDFGCNGSWSTTCPSLYVSFIIHFLAIVTRITIQLMEVCILFRRLLKWGETDTPRCIIWAWNWEVRRWDIKERWRQYPEECQWQKFSKMKTNFNIHDQDYANIHHLRQRWWQYSWWRWCLTQTKMMTIYLQIMYSYRNLSFIFF